MERDTDRETLRQLLHEKNHATALEQVLEIAARATDPLTVALARVMEVRHIRSLGNQQGGLVAGAELVAAVQALTAAPPPEREFDVFLLLVGLESVLCSTLDVPEVPLTATAGVIDGVAQLLTHVGCHDYRAQLMRCRLYDVAGDTERIPAIVETLTPHINFRNFYREHLGCPACARTLLGALLGPKVSPEFLAEWLRPVLLDDGIYPGDTEKTRKQLKFTCQSSSHHLHYARSLLWHGRVAEADHHGDACRDQDRDPCFLLPTIFFLELAMAQRGEPAIVERIALLRPRLSRHEDVWETMLGAVRVAQAMTQIDEGTPDEHAELWALARRCAERLDRRLARPRHLEFVERERTAGPPFMQVPLVDVVPPVG